MPFSLLPATLRPTARQPPPYNFSRLAALGCCPAKKLLCPYCDAV